MRNPTIVATVVGILALTGSAEAQQPITIRAGTLIDGKGGVTRNAVITVNGAQIAGIGASDNGRVTYDFPALTVLPGLFDTHVHIGAHFGKDGRASTPGETPAEQALAAAGNAYALLMAGFTTVQSVGAASDVPLREAIASGRIPGPRLRT